MLSQEIIEDAERSWRKDDAQPVNHALQRLPECGRTGHRAQHHKDRG